MPRRGQQRIRKTTCPFCKRVIACNGFGRLRKHSMAARARFPYQTNPTCPGTLTFSGGAIR